MMIKILFSIFKAPLRNVMKAIYKGRYFYGVEFHNKNNIFIDSSVNIEQKTRVWVIHPSLSKKNIIVKRKCWIGRDVEIQTSFDSEIILEKNVSIQDRCKLLGSIYIGQDTLLAPDVFISSGAHFFDKIPHLTIKKQDGVLVNTQDGFERNEKPVFIGEDCWIGKGVILKNGITIGKGAVIAANSLVNKNVPPYQVYGGIPAKFLKDRLSFDPPRELNFENKEHWPFFYSGFDFDELQEGLLLTKQAICILKKEQNDKILVIEGNVQCEGIINIWFNGQNVESKKGSIGYSELRINLSIKSEFSKALPNFCANVLNHLNQYNVISIEFISEVSTEKKGFKIQRIKVNETVN